MARSDAENKEKNEYRTTTRKWVIGTVIAVVVFIILLLVFNRRSDVVSDGDQPTGLEMDSASLFSTDEDLFTVV